ncbi:CHAT domain-containing protein [Aquimarina sediminis]|uniref:CHAT domain-containing protein n=1 Tax=Aquimarina sediminis TaxID=2070536 RepID=UPI000CA03EE9|nr:CHAT domain-containing protein [Aquimarina sediminis]
MRYHYYTIIYLLVFFLSLSAYSQNAITLLESEYKKLETSNIDYNGKIERINSLLEEKKQFADSIRLSLLYDKLSKLNHRNGDYKNAILNIKRALLIQESYVDSIPSIINKSYNNLAYYYLFSGDEAKAIQTFKTLVKQSHKDSYTIKAYTIGLTKLYTNRGDYYKVLDYLNEAENTIKQANDSILNKERYRIYLSFSNVYSQTMKKSHYNRALGYLKKAENSISHLSKRTQLKNQIIIYTTYGYIYDELKQYHKALTNYKKALELGLNEGMTNKSQLATIYNSLGYIYTKLEQHELAFENYKKGLLLDSQKTSIYDNLGDYYLNKQNYIEALTNYQKAIYYGINQYEDIDYKELPNLEKLTQSYNKVELVNDLKDKAKAWLKFYKKTKKEDHLQHGLSTIILADQLVDIIRSESTEQQSKYFWREKGIDLYMLATSICYELNDYKQAFYFMEKSKSLSLLEDLTHEEAKTRAALPETIKEKEYILKQNIYETIELHRNDSTLSISEKQSILFKHKKEYEIFINSLEKDYPGYYHYKKEIDICSFDEGYSKIISPSTGIIQYILTKNEGYGIFITDSDIHFFKIPDVQLLNDQIKTITTLTSKPFTTQQQLDTYITLSFSIYQKLFPFRDTLQLLSNKRILVIPDYTLQYFPFEALVTDSSSKTSPIPYLIYNTDISYAYSLSLLKKVKRKNRNPKSKLIGFAPIHFKKQQLSSLNRSKYKMTEIEKLFSGDVLYEQEATKSNFVSVSNDYNIIHLSTHASSLSNQEPWIAFHDDILTLNELYFIKNQADLVVLDACKTGIGKLQLGEGVLSISRGFFHSGAKSVISSLWSTNEKSSTTIITDFYSYLKEGETKSAALRKAKLQYLQSHQLSENSPHYWAPLVLTGSIENSLHPNNNSYFLFIGILFLALIIIAIWFKYKR